MADSILVPDDEALDRERDAEPVDPKLTAPYPEHATDIRLVA